MITAAAIATCAILGGLGVFQGLLVCRLRLGRFAWGGGHDVLPPRLRIASAATVAIYAGLGWVVLARSGVIEAGGDAVGALAWAAAGLFLLGTAGNLASPSRHERLVMAPVAGVLCALCTLIAAG